MFSCDQRCHGIIVGAAPFASRKPGVTRVQDDNDPRLCQVQKAGNLAPSKGGIGDPAIVEFVGREVIGAPIILQAMARERYYDGVLTFGGLDCALDRAANGIGRRSLIGERRDDALGVELSRQGFNAAPSRSAS